MLGADTTRPFLIDGALHWLPTNAEIEQDPDPAPPAYRSQAHADHCMNMRHLARGGRHAKAET